MENEKESPPVHPPAHPRSTPGPPRSTGLFITFEGIDGSGKSSLAAWLASTLPGCVRTFEPGGTPAGHVFREMILTVAELQPVTRLLLFLADRAEHVPLIRAHLDAGTHVVCDRFHDSTYAYQGTDGLVYPHETASSAALHDGSEGTSWKAQVLMARKITLGAAEEAARADILPNLTFLLDCPADVARSRLAGQGLDHFESKPRAWHNAVRDAFLARAAEEPDRIVVLDATQSVEFLRIRVQAEVEGRL